MAKNDIFLIEKLAEFYSGLNYNDISEEVIQKAKMSLLDYLFVYVVGFHKGVLSGKILDFVQQKTKDCNSTILMAGIKTDVEFAVLASGLISHSVELDDGHRYGTAHPAVVVIPAVLALGEKTNSTFAEVLKAIIIGYDIMLRLSKAINPSHLRRGFHSTSTTGTIGSSAASAVILRLSSEKMVHAVSLAGLFSSGLQEMLHSNPSAKAIQVGQAARSGIDAAFFAASGMKGPVSLLEGQHGWIKAMSDSFSENDLIGDLGTRWEIMNTYTKLYPTCRHCHHAIDLAIQAFNEGFNLSNIKKIKIRTYTLGIAEVGIIRQPKDIEEAMFSVSYSVAIALKYGFLKIEDLERKLTDNKIMEFSSIIEIEVDGEMDAKYPAERGCVLELLTVSGEKMIYKTHLPKGEPDTKLTETEYLTKFRNITSEYVKKNLELTIAVYEEMGLPEESLYAISKAIDMLQYVFVRIIPALIVVSTLFISWVCILLSKPMLKAGKLFYPDFGSLKTWKAPEFMVWIVIIFGIMLLLPSTLLKLLGLNGIIMLMSIYFFAGIAIVSFFFEKKKLPRMLRFVLYAIMAFQQIILFLLIGLGFFDTWLNVRKLDTGETGRGC